MASEGIFRWSPNPARNEFLTINLTQRLLQVYQATGHAKPGRFEHERVSGYVNFPLPNTYDWSPIEPGLLAVGTSQGQVHLLRIDDSSNATHTLPVRAQRPCQSVAFNTTGLLAVGLDRVRNDSCLQIWDIEQKLAGWDRSKSGWDLPSNSIEPRKVEASLPVTSMKFFEDQPQSLVVGIKNQSVRILDLREPSPSVLNFPTKCNNNISIDYADSNYFASSSLDSPALVIWDRRASSRAEVSSLYLESLDSEEITFGTALSLNCAIEAEKSGSYVRSMRFCRDQRNTLGILSNSGYLQVVRLNKEYIEPSLDNGFKDSPQLLQVRRSYDLGNLYHDDEPKSRPDTRIVSFDWIPLGSSDLQPRIVALRGSGTFDVMQMPTTEAGQLADLMQWQAPHRLEDPYLTLPSFTDSQEQSKILGPLYVGDIKGQLPSFGPAKPTASKLRRYLASNLETLIHTKFDAVVDQLALGSSQSSNHRRKRLTLDSTANGQSTFGPRSSLRKVKIDSRVRNGKILSSREMHDLSHYSAQIEAKQSKAEWEQRDCMMLIRAVNGYLFNGKLNKSIVQGDKWLKDVWDWIAGAEAAAEDDGMVGLGVDLSYMGVYTIWHNILGKTAKARFLDGVPTQLDATEWEELAGNINERAGHNNFSGIETLWPQHRRLCLAVCGLAKSDAELEQEFASLVADGQYTMAAARALFESIPERAVEILKSAGAGLLFVAMALDIKLRSKEAVVLDESEWTNSLSDHPRLEEDPWLRVIYGYITHGNWALIANESSLPLRDRIGIALRNFRDIQLSDWLLERMDEVTATGDIEGIILAGITDHMVNILAKYVEKFNDIQTPVLIMSYSHPRYLQDPRCEAWRKAYRDYLQRHRKFILRVQYEQQSTIKSRLRDGKSVIRPWPRQVTIRCLNCDAHAANDLANTSSAPATSNPSQSFDTRTNPLQVAGTNAGLCCSRCGSLLSRCAVCMEVVGVPRSDRPELSNDPQIRRMANFPTFCLKCKHVSHMDHSIAWFRRHGECPVPECRCQCEEVREGAS